MDNASQPEQLLEWRRTVRACRKCTLLTDGKPIDVNDVNQLNQASIHYETRIREGKIRGWAMAMLDKRPEAECSLDILRESCRSRIVAILEAPNDDDTYLISRGYLTVDNDTDETGKFTHRLFDHIGISVENVIFTNTVQCLPVYRGTKYNVTQNQRMNCRAHLWSLVQIVKPKVILAFGNEALRALHRFESFRLNGKALRLSDVSMNKMVGQAISGWWSTTVIPLFHPGPIVRAAAVRKNGLPGNGRSEKDQMRDIEIVRRFFC